MLHEHLQADIICEDGRPLRRSIGAARYVRRRRVELGEQETSLRAALVADDVTGDGETIREEILFMTVDTNGDPQKKKVTNLRVSLRRLQQRLEAFITLGFLIICLPPLGDGLTVEDEQVEKGVEEEDGVGLDGHGVEEDRLRLLVEAVGRQGFANHGTGLGEHEWNSFIPIESRFIWRVIKHLQELTPPQMEHELRVDGEIFRQPERLGLVLAIVGKLLAQTDKHTIEPAQDVRPVVNLCLEDGDARHEDGGGFLVEGVCDLRAGPFGPVASDGGDTQAKLAARVLVVGNKLDEAARTWLHGLSVLVDDLKVDGRRGLGRDAAHLPLRGLPDANLRFADRGGFLVSGNGGTDQAAYFQFPRGLSRKRPQQFHIIESHLQITLPVLGEDAVEALLEDGGGERVRQDHEPARMVDHGFHLEQADLVEATGEDIDGVAVG
ncbi:hypothetical protein BC938DRAFT_481224 [Jimgerdemannia flammicorona]|uniref:Uncharacterized protein n=1 Tax=Jimgerdemannia flammicorona TaxID=994334 RepID=A0A433QHB8_9FUNG|nr:hypothetical protein BC938DRAFT_481224 [Jimgerdemannia flammicorona]